MTEKVKLTQKQADAIEIIKGNPEFLDGDLIKQIEKGWSIGKYKCLNELTTDKFIRALYLPDGYEVEPEYKVGDYTTNTRTGVTIKLDEDKAEFVNSHYLNKDELRHATESEIAQEKERQKWTKIGRKPDEYHHYDIAYDNMHDCFVEVDDPAVSTTPFLRVANLDDKSDSREIDPFQLTLVCPADKRFDHE